jgi:hypothetical protein
VHQVGYLTEINARCTVNKTLNAVQMFMLHSWYHKECLFKEFLILDLRTSIFKLIRIFDANFVFINHLTPNGQFSGRTAPLTYRCYIFLFIQQIYVLNILNTLHILRFSLFKMSFIS